MFKGDRIQELLKERKKTKKDLYEAIGLSAVGLKKVLDGADLRASNLEKIADYFELPIDYFFDREIEIDKEGYSQEAQKEIKLLREILSEKERLIQVLMSK